MKIRDINGTDRNCRKAYFDPLWPGFISVDFESKHRKGYKHTEWYPIDQFLQQNPQLANIVNHGGSAGREPDVVGVVTKASANNLKDLSQNWRQNIYAGYQVWISRGRGEGQTRTILKNGKNTLTIAAKWTTLPDATSQYVISKNLGNVQASANKLPIVELKELEERARKMDIDRGRKPAERQYTRGKQ